METNIYRRDSVYTIIGSADLLTSDHPLTHKTYLTDVGGIITAAV